jgi:hypothetical protein
MTGQAAGVGDTARDRADKFRRGVASGDPGKCLAFATFGRLPVTCRMRRRSSLTVPLGKLSRIAVSLRPSADGRQDFVKCEPDHTCS